MKRSFYLTWIIGGAILATIAILGIGFLSAMALNPNGNTSPPPWGIMLGMAAGLVLYWSALCWAVGLLKRKPLVSVLIVASALALAFVYPTLDQARYRDQQVQAMDAGLIGIPPDWTGKTALLIWPGKSECDYDCWNLALHMEARVVVLAGEHARTVDFSDTVNLLEQPLEEMAYVDGTNGQTRQQPAENVVEIDYVIIHHEQSSDFDDVFEALRPAGIARDGLHIDAMIVEVEDPTQFDLSTAPIRLRLIHVSRTISETPYFPNTGRRLYWNNADRRANYERAKSYFCSEQARSPHWCFNAFD